MLSLLPLGLSRYILRVILKARVLIMHSFFATVVDFSREQWGWIILVIKFPTSSGEGSDNVKTIFNLYWVLSLVSGS